MKKLRLLASNMLFYLANKLNPDGELWPTLYGSDTIELNAKDVKVSPNWSTYRTGTKVYTAKLAFVRPIHEVECIHEPSKQFNGWGYRTCTICNKELEPIWKARK